MGERRVLVIGSQCAALPNSHLAFLPGVAEELYRVLTDPALGGCVPALENHNKSLLIDPTVAATDSAITAAMARASQDAASLFVAFVGHGERTEDDFYLLPYDASLPPDSATALFIAKRLQELLRRHDRLDGLVLLIDTCYSGAGTLQAATHWPHTIAAAGGRFEVLSAAAADRPAFDGCFTATLTALLRTGVPKLGENLRCSELHGLIQDRCGQQDATYLAFARRRIIPEGDEGLWLARNQAHTATTAPLAHTPTWAQVERLTSSLERTPQLEQLVDMTRASRCVAVVGPAGVGKSTLVATLARAELADDLIPARFVHGLAFASPTTTASQLATDLSRQLNLTVQDFAAAAEEFRRQTRLAEWEGLDPLTQQVVGPLRQLAPERTVRLAIDGLDQFPAPVAPIALAALDELATDPALESIRLVVTARPDTTLPSIHRLLTLDRVESIYIERYLEHRKVPPDRASGILHQVDGNWLVARLLADLATEVDGNPMGAPRTLYTAYRDELLRAGADDPASWTQTLRPVLAALAVAGVGPVLPLPLLCHASGLLGGPDQPARVRDVLVRLRGLVVRGNPGTSEEHIGTFHTTFADYLRGDQDFAIDERAAHQGLVDAIQALAPVAEYNPSDSLHRYAAAAEAEHRWALGQYVEVLRSLVARSSNIPAENLGRWMSWKDRFQTVLGPDHPNTLTTRNNVAYWTAQTGDAGEALRLSAELLHDEQRLLGPNHPNTLTTRNNIAGWTGQTGDAREALRLFEELLPDQLRVLGPNHRNALTTRNNIANWTGSAGEGREALRLFEELLPDLQRVLGPDHPETLRVRNSIAHWTGETGDARAALRLFRELLPDQERVLGLDHPDTLTTRNNMAAWTGEAGDVREALRLLYELLPDRQRVLGSDHPDTLTTRNNIAAWTGRIGDAREAVRLFEELLPDQQRVLGPDHPETLRTRNNIAHWTGEAGNAREALRLLQELLPDLQRVLGPDHPETLRARNNIAGWTSKTGHVPEALRLFEELLPDLQRVLGPDHPETLRVRGNIAALTGETGDAPEALRLFEELLPDLQRVLGPDHPETLRVRNNIAGWMSKTGHVPEALQSLQELLLDLQRVLGSDHPDTLLVRNNIAGLMAEKGDARAALRLYRELLPDQQRVLGLDHPDTLTTRANIAHFTEKVGDAHEALRLFEELLPDRQRVLGSEHPDTLKTSNRIKDLRKGRRRQR
jgi:Tetratricopeptide repeat/AAA ATPase domain